MKRILMSVAAALVVAIVVALALGAVGFAQRGGRGWRGGDDANHAGGKVTAVSATAITVAGRDGAAREILVTESTSFVRNGGPAALTDFVAGDFVRARGAANDAGQFVAEQIHGGDRGPRGGRGGHGGGPPDAARHAGGEVVSVDAAAGTITVERRGDATDVIRVTETTEIVRNGQAATLADFVAGDHLRARGARDEAGQLVAERIFGGDERPGRRH